METDGIIVARVIAGDHNVYGQLVMRYLSAVEKRVMRYVQKHSLVKQLANDAFAKGFVKLATLRDKEKFRPWIFRLADREVIDYQRRRNRDRRWVNSLVKVNHYLSSVNAATGAGPDILEQKERLQQLSRAILDLKPQDREIIELHYYEGRSVLL